MKPWKKVIATGLAGAILLGCLGIASAATSTTSSTAKTVNTIVKKTDVKKAPLTLTQ